MMAAVLVWFLACMTYLVQALFRESETWARLKRWRRTRRDMRHEAVKAENFLAVERMQQRFDLWRQVRADLKQATPEQKLEIEAFLAVLEGVMQERGYLSFVSAAIGIEARVSRAARIISAVPQYIAIEILERTETARDQIERTRKAARH
jgi:hypothetical protein